MNMIKIKVYSSPFCGYCKMAKDFFDSMGVPYEEVDVSENEEAAKDMVERTGQMGVPVIEMGDEMIIGFDKKRIQDILAKEGIKQE